jgi:hypothetical protein
VFLPDEDFQTVIEAHVLVAQIWWPYRIFPILRPIDAGAQLQDCHVIPNTNERWRPGGE